MVTETRSRHLFQNRANYFQPMSSDLQEVIATHCSPYQGSRKSQEHPIGIPRLSQAIQQKRSGSVTTPQRVRPRDTVEEVNRGVPRGYWEEGFKHATGPR